MSMLYERNQHEPLSLIAIDEKLLGAATSAAEANHRKRSIIRFHELDESLQRMLNAIEPESYTRPHRHTDKAELFVALRGSALVVRFSENGTPQEGVVVSAEGPIRGAEIPPGAWHCLVSLARGTVMFEVKQGPYIAETDKQPAAWAPPEENRPAGLAYLAELRAYFERLIPVVAARNEIEAEEEDIC